MKALKAVLILVVFAVSSQVLAKANLDVSEFNDIIEENAKLQSELTERVRVQAGIISIKEENFGKIYDENRTINIPTENIAVRQSEQIGLAKRDSLRQSSQNLDSVDKLAAEVREAGRAE